MPTVLTGVTRDMAIANEETFGPVVVVEVVDTPEEAVAAANRTLYGLTSSILAGDTYRAFELAPKGSLHCSEMSIDPPGSTLKSRKSSTGPPGSKL